MKARWFIALVFLAAFPRMASAEQSAPWGLASLMADLHAVPSAKAHFTERQYLRMLTKPLDATGTVRYAAPNLLEKITTTPTAESMLLQGDSLTGVQANGKKFSISLSEHPDVGAFVEGIRSTMAGDLPTLEKYYTVSFKGTRGEWQLTLAPLDPTVRSKVQYIAIDGNGAQLVHINYVQADGDRSEMTIFPDGP